MTTFNHLFRLWMSVALVLLAGCESDAVLLPLDHNASQVTHVHVKVGVELNSTIQSLAGVQGGPVPMVVGDEDLSSKFTEAGVSLLRIPDGYLCTTSLNGIFKDAEAPTDAPESYTFDALDTVVNGMFSSSFAPETVVYQAQFQLAGECEVDENGLQTGVRPDDIQRWSEVVVNVLRHLNRSLLDADNPADAIFLDGALQTNVRAVEFIADPIHRGGYTSVADVVSDFGVWSAAIKAAFPNTDEGPVIQVISPSLPVAAAADLDGHDIEVFLDGVVTLNGAQDLDVLSFSYWGDDPIEAGLIAQKIRTMLDARGLTDVALWAGGYQPAGALSAQDNALAQSWSARTAALTTAFWMAWQGLVDAAIFERGDRRALCAGTTGCDATKVAESALFTGDGVWRPAGVAWFAWRYLHTHVRIEADASSEDPNNPIWVAAAKDRSPCADPTATGCGRVHVLISQPGVDGEPIPTSILFKVSGLDEITGANGKVRVDRLAVTATTTSLTPTDSRVVSVVDGEFIWPIDSSSPTLEFLTMEKEDQ